MPASKSTIPRPSAGVLRELYVEQRLGCPEIGRRFERDAKTVHWWLREAAIPTRSRGHDERQHFKLGHTSSIGRIPSAETRAKIGAASVGRAWKRGNEHWLRNVPPEQNPNWKGGRTPERQEFYRSAEWRAAACFVWARDNGCCRNCGLDWNSVDRATTATFHVHHVFSFQIRELRSNPDLLVLLCRPCHLWVHSNANVTRAWLPQEFDSTAFPTLDDLDDFPPLDVGEWIVSERRGREAYNRSLRARGIDK